MIYFNFDYKNSTQHCTDFALVCAFYSSFFTSYNLQNLAYRLCFPFSAVDLYTQHKHTHILAPFSHEDKLPVRTGCQKYLFRSFRG